MKRLLLFVLMLVAFGMPNIASTYAQTYPGSSSSVGVFDPADYFEIVVQTDSTIPEPAAYAEWFLGQIGVTNHADKRLHHTYKHALTGFSVYLTKYEYDRASRLALPGLTSMLLSEWGEITVIPITQVEGQMPEHNMDPTREVVPFNVQRAGTAPNPANTTDYTGIDVAVIDTGVDRFHPDLNVVGGFDCVSTIGDAPDFGYDGYGHGTHVAGTIAARVNQVGVVGVAPGARIWSYKVLDSEGRGSFASVLCGLDKVAEAYQVIDVANMSLGGGGGETQCGGEDPMHDAICAVTDLGVIVVVAAGNSSADAVDHIPANYDEVVTVSAYADFDGQPGGGSTAPQNRCYGLSVDDELAAYSNYGPDIDIAAPGTCVLSTLPGDPNGKSGGYEPKWGFASGTSMATPMVAGCVARYLAANPDQAEFAVEQILTYSDARSDAVKGDHDGLHEPLLYCDAVPRYEGTASDYEG